MDTTEMANATLQSFIIIIFFLQEAVFEYLPFTVAPLMGLRT